MSAFNKFDCFVEDVAEKIHNLGSDTLKFALSNVAPTANKTLFSEITEITAHNGYTAGGVVSPQISSGQSGGFYVLVLTPEDITASGGTIGAFRYVVLYNDTATNKNLIGWFDYGSSITLSDGETFKIIPDAVGGTLTLQ